MSKYKNLILILLLIPFSAYYFLSGVWGQSDEPSEFTQEEINKEIVRTAFSFQSHLGEDILYRGFDPNYIHHLAGHGPPLTLESTNSWLCRDSLFYPIGFYISARVMDIIAEGDKVVIRFYFELWYKRESWGNISTQQFLSSDIWILRIAHGKIVEGWSISEPHGDTLSREGRMKALVREAILAFDEDPYDANLPEQFDPNYVQYGPTYASPEIPYPHGFLEDFGGGYAVIPVTFESIIAQGGMVSVRLSYDTIYPSQNDATGNAVELATYLIADGKIVEGWVAILWSQVDIIRE
jgi:predicted SnoaL-like aldol condensation-catalyzing enzyme